MIDLGWFEILAIFVAVLVVVKPEDLPGLMRDVMQGFYKFRDVITDLRIEAKHLIDETGVQDIKDQVERLKNMPEPDWDNQPQNDKAKDIDKSS